jgi:hypothetical protein
MAVLGVAPSAYNPTPTESRANARRAKKEDFTARNFATIAPAAQDLALSTSANWPIACH